MSRAQQKEQTRQRILHAAGRGFRESGFNGLGVDGLARAAGVTSGAFYAHFDSKRSAFQAALLAGMDELRKGIQHFQAEHGAHWWPAFVQFYLGEKRECALADSCALQSLSTEVARADAECRAAFASELATVADLITHHPGAPAYPLAALATLIGSVTLARAAGPDLAASIVAQSQHHLS